MRSLATFIATLAVCACGNGPLTHDTPDATLPWPSHRTQLTIPDAGLGFVSNNGSDQVSVLDLSAASTVGNFRVGIDPLANDGPHHLAVDPIAGHLFVALAYPPPGVPSGPHAGHGASSVQGWVQMLAIDDLHEIARHQIEANPGDIVLTPDRTKVVVTHFNYTDAYATLAAGGSLADARSNLWVLDAVHNLARLASVPLCVMAHGVVISSDGVRAYVACNGEDQLVIFNLVTNMVEARINVGPGASPVPSTMYGPYAVTMTDDQQFVLVGDREGRDLRVFSVASGQFEHTINVRSSVFFGTETADHAYVILPVQTPDGIVRVRRSDWQIDLFVRVAPADCVYPHEVTRGPDGKFYLVCEAVGSDTTRVAPSRVDVLDPATLAVTAHFDVGVYPDRVVFATRLP